MSIDASTMPINPFFVIAAVVYAAASALITGPEIANREIARSNWRQVCQSEIAAEINATRRPNQFIPGVPDAGDLICSFYPELSDLCDMIPDPNAAARETERRLRAAEDRRIRQAVKGAADACSCAEQVYVEEQRLGLALYAGSGRLITPPSVKNRKAALSRALRSPICQQEG